ncbi:MAG: helix-turn-helix domain-containing protein [Ferruginibacter sp.]|nr:helix-turn-helix domain-containing protein [Bacteroidota bacterium]MBX2919720.1 helix-turn-helix domain-containing protein [Ferruginibacter sp.]
MKKKQDQAPIFNIRQHCDTKDVKNIKIAALNEKSCTIAEFEENHRHQYYEIVWLKRGSGVHNIDMVNYKYEGSTLFLLSPGQMHLIKPEEKPDGYVIKFLPSLFRDAKDMDEYVLNTTLFDNIQVEPMIKVSSAAHTAFEDVFAKMDAEFNVDEEDKEKILLSYLKILITHINRLKKNKITQTAIKTDINLKLFQDYKIEVEKHYKKEHGVQFYADSLFTQPRTLNSLSQKYAGKTAGEIIADRIILEAKRELYYSTISVKEIGYALGFDDPAYFTRFFKKQTGVSPNEYKVQGSDEKMLKTNAG